MALITMSHASVANITATSSPIPNGMHPSAASQQSNHSKESSQESRFLSPPATDSGGDSPPYVPDLDDKYSLDQTRYKNARYTDAIRRTKSGRPRGEDSAEVVRPNHSNLLRESSILNSGSPSSSPQDLLKARVHAGRRALARSLASGQDKLSIRKASAVPASELSRKLVKVVEKRSQTWQSRSMIPRSYTLFLLADRQGWNLATQTVAPQLDQVVAAATYVRSSRRSGQSVFLQSVQPRATKNKRVHDSSSVKQIETTREKRFETPATITLRKASKASNYQPFADLVPIRQHKIAFKEHGEKSDLSKLTLYSGTKPRTIPEVKDGSLKGRASSQLKGTSYLSLLQDGVSASVNMLNSPAQAYYQQDGLRLGAPNPAITIAEAYALPESRRGVKKRKPSLSDIEALRQTSTVQIRPGGSVHEIIWEKDDTPSSWSSRSSPPFEQVHNVKRSVKSPTTNVLGKPGQVFPSSPDFADLEPSKKKEGKRVVSWIDPWVSTKGRREKRLPEPKEDETGNKVRSVGPTSLHAATINDTKRWSVAVVPHRSSVVSFPPLKPRRTTTEWRNTPPADLNDPEAGQPKDRSAFPTNNITNYAPNVSDTLPPADDAEEERKNLTRSQSGVLGEQKTGSRLGSSSHARLPSDCLNEQPASLLRSADEVVTRARKSISHILLGSNRELPDGMYVGGTRVSKAKQVLRPQIHCSDVYRARSVSDRAENHASRPGNDEPPKVQCFSSRLALVDQETARRGHACSYRESNFDWEELVS